MLDGDRIDVVRKAGGYLARRRIGTAVLALGITTFLVGSVVDLLQRPSPLFGDCWMLCEPYYGSAIELAVLFGSMALTLLGLLLRRKRWP